MEVLKVIGSFMRKYRVAHNNRPLIKCGKVVGERSALLYSHPVTASPPRSASRQTDCNTFLCISRYDLRVPARRTRRGNEKNKERKRVRARGQVQPQVAASGALGGNWRAPCARPVRTTRVYFRQISKTRFSVKHNTTGEHEHSCGHGCVVCSR